MDTEILKILEKGVLCLDIGVFMPVPIEFINVDFTIETTNASSSDKLTDIVGIEDGC